MDLITGKFSSDASQRPGNFDSVGFTLFFTLEQCCKYWYDWQDDQSCLLNTPDSPGEPQDPTVPPVTPENPTVPSGLFGGGDGGDGGGNGGDNSSGNGDNGGDNSSGNGGNGGDDGGDDGSDKSDSKFYLIDGMICEASTSGEMEGNYFATQFDCCTNIQEFNLRKICCDESVDSPEDQLECLLVEAADPVVDKEDDSGKEEGDDPAVVKEDKPAVLEKEEQFYVSNKNCYSTANGVLSGGTLYSSRFDCCDSLGSKEDRHACVWNNSSPNLQPGASKTPSSASKLARGRYVIAAAVCLCFQFM
mmetsp:Transcript_2848/g.4361  ORF Transcript_2848/g.4361 Transcript_2848/m.4361 type:complete len:304 (-) Transcript_2848:103-1014(-)